MSMRQLRHFLLALFCGLLWLHTSSHGQQPAGHNVPVQGQLVSRVQGPVPGVTVYLVHQALGRSAPSITDAYGRFGWNAIPVRPEAYYLEAYWGSKLIYRQPLLVNGPMALPTITL